MGYAHRQIRWSQTKLKKCHIDIYVKTKNWSYTCSEALNPLQHLFQAFNSLLRSFTGSSSLYFQARTAWRLLMMLIFSELQWNRSFRPKATSAKSFLMLLDYRIKIIFFGHHSKTVPRKSSIKGLYVSAGGFTFVQGRAWPSNLTNSANF